MTTTRRSPEWDPTLHVSDGSHRRTGPTTESDALAAWHDRRDAHITEHLDEAFENNVNLTGDDELHELIDLVSKATDGRVSYDSSTQVGSARLYRFNGIEGEHFRSESIRLLQDILETPTGL